MKNFLKKLSENNLKINFGIHHLKRGPFIVYGGGSGFNTLETFILTKYNIKPYAVVDEKYSEELTKEGVLYLSPKMLQTRKDLLNYSMIVSIGNKKFREQAIFNLQNMGFHIITHAFDIFEYHLAYSNNNFEVNSKDILLANITRILSAYELLSDKKSRKIFRQLLKFYFSGNIEVINNDPLIDQYFPRDIEIKSFSRFINCGSYDGDTIRCLNSKIGRIEELICIEPDKTNFDKLNKYISENLDLIANKVIIYPCGLSDSEQVIKFNSGSNVNSSIGRGGDSYIQTISLDNVLFNFRPTYINMDIEGSEKEAIQGASKTISNNIVDLAIAIYHRPEDLWTILLKINEIKKDYNFYIRNYTGRPAETVLYCIHK
jgi:FkbM family methyltransferase